jgi:hypothetical protein
MKITRRQLRQLIAEAYRTGIPYRSPIDQSDTMVTQKYPQFTDKIAASEPRQREAFKSALDPNRPQPVINIRGIDDPRFGVTQRQINDLVDEFFSYNPQAFAGAMSQGGMTMRQIAEEIFDYLLTGPGVGYEVLYDDDGLNARNQHDIEEVIRRYEDALSRPHHKQLGHIS